MVQKVMNTQRQTGFTILELLIATTIFSVVLLLAATAMIQIGRTYYKGTEQTRAQEVAREIVDQISRDIQFSGAPISGTEPGKNDNYYALVSPSPHEFESDNQNAFYGGLPAFTREQIQTFCVGEKRYIAVLNRMMDPDFNGGNPADLSDTFRWGQVLVTYNDTGSQNPVIPGSGCQGPIITDLPTPGFCDTPPLPKPASTGCLKLPGHTYKELMSPGMLLARLTVQPLGANGLWQISIKVINTDSRDFVDESGGIGNWRCRTNRSSSQFCAEAELTTTVKKLVD